MTDLPRAFALSLGQLADPAILRVLGKSLAVTLAIFAVFGAGLYLVIARAVAGWGYADAGLAGAAATALIAIAALWLLFRIIALAVLQFFADDVVRAVEARHYPAAAGVPELRFAPALAASTRGLVRAVAVNALALPLALALLVTGIGTALLLWAVNAWLLGRELTEMVWLRHRAGKADGLPVSGSARFALGGVTAVLLMIPFVNLIAPVLGAASAAHMVHRGRAARA